MKIKVLLAGFGLSGVIVFAHYRVHVSVDKRRKEAVCPFQRGASSPWILYFSPLPASSIALHFKWKRRAKLNS